MVNRHDIEEFARKIAEQFHPEKIILFGSYAYGTPTPDSDVDLMVIMDHDTRNVEKAIEICCAFRFGHPLDLFVRRPVDIANRIAMDDWFIRDIVEKGTVLYEATYA